MWSLLHQSAFQCCPSQQLGYHLFSSISTKENPTRRKSRAIIYFSLNLSFSVPHSCEIIASGVDISQAMDENTLRRSPRRRSPAKQVDFDTAMDGVVPRSKSPSRKSLERTSRSRSPIRKSPKKATSDISRLGLFGAYQLESDKAFISNNSSGAISTDVLTAGEEPLDETDTKSTLSSPPRPANWMQLTETFPQSNVQRDGLGLFGQPSSPISHWQPSTSLNQLQPTSQEIGFFRQSINPRSSPLSFNASPFQPRSPFGH
ncbi:hypothetical protein NA56DRAFT_293889 [Hyaloscypha hepaticicola]|uniref:Uncharacterized protein n=1 Tax=Hyaloscypha hepaticicola TaxID=2082293 RepID=A0A2J6QK77_9HELO|nr:hypothetical protein NA56DRAFT_293889 [Hyaloscypha hepaticicola]